MPKRVDSKRIDLTGKQLKNDDKFLVRLPKEDLERFNEIIQQKAINRSELLRQWIRKYIEENEKK